MNSQPAPHTRRASLWLLVTIAVAQITMLAHAQSGSDKSKRAPGSSKAAHADPLRAEDPAKVEAELKRLRKVGGRTCSASVAERTREGLPDALALIALDTLAACAHPPTAAPAVTELFTHRNAQVRARAAKAAGELELRKAASALVKQLDDGDADVRAAAADSLVQLRSRAQLKSLVALWSAGSQEAGRVLANVARPSDLGRLIQPLEAATFERSIAVLEPIMGRKDWPVPARLKVVSALQDTGLLAARGVLQQWSQALGDKRLRRASFEAAKAMDPEAEEAEPEQGVNARPRRPSAARDGRLAAGGQR